MVLWDLYLFYLLGIAHFPGNCVQEASVFESEEESVWADQQSVEQNGGQQLWDWERDKVCEKSLIVILNTACSSFNNKHFEISQKLNQLKENFNWLTVRAKGCYFADKTPLLTLNMAWYSKNWH